MELEASLISRKWTVRHARRTFHVNCTESDMQTLTLCNRDNREVWEQTQDGSEALNIYSLASDTPKERRRVQEDFELIKQLIRFCIEHWDNPFMEKIKEAMQEQKEALEAP